ncbi:MAG: thioredoxin family protein [Kaiparowitsia implicata GSE-PSE-MK54-09C]|jgi:thiol-disulfide isomerase/thioredoxin|nr:thioredoxin family protein [Kaiparowitsia implicata GSE-PSE-MK54-09C]
MTANSPGSPPPSNPDLSAGLERRIRNFLVVMVAIALSIALVFGLRSESSAGSLETLAAEATPLEVAQLDSKPMLMEFYANWCTSCRAMAGDMLTLKQEYGDRINFVMLNVDNNKWLPELLNYRVDGIPHFVFIDGDGDALGTIIGEVPATVMASNLDALAANEAELPFAKASGQTSKVSDPLAPQASAGEDPRSHGAQVQPSL